MKLIPCDNKESCSYKSNCSLCEGSGEVLKRPARLMGVTYFNDKWMGDEHFGKCPLCNGRVYCEKPPMPVLAPKYCMWRRLAEA